MVLFQLVEGTVLVVMFQELPLEAVLLAVFQEVEDDGSAVTELLFQEVEDAEVGEFVRVFDRVEDKEGLLLLDQDVPVFHSLLLSPLLEVEAFHAPIFGETEGCSWTLVVFQSLDLLDELKLLLGALKSFAEDVFHSPSFAEDWLFCWEGAAFQSPSFEEEVVEVEVFHVLVLEVGAFHPLELAWEGVEELEVTDEELQLELGLEVGAFQSFDLEDELPQVLDFDDEAPLSTGLDEVPHSFEADLGAEEVVFHVLELEVAAFHVLEFEEVDPKEVLVFEGCELHSLDLFQPFVGLEDQSPPEDETEDVPQLDPLRVEVLWGFPLEEDEFQLDPSSLNEPLASF